MKTWIIILTIAYAVFRLASMFTENYIRNNDIERLKYKYTNGQTVPGILFGIFWLLRVLCLAADSILIIIYILFL